MKVSHIVSIDEFYVQSCDQLHRIKEMSDILSSSSPPLKQLDVDSLREGNSSFILYNISSTGFTVCSMDRHALCGGVSQ